MISKANDQGKLVTCRRFSNFEICTQLSGNWIGVGYLVTELWAIYQCWKQHKTKKFGNSFCSQYLKNHIYYIWLIPLDHATCFTHTFCLYWWCLPSTDFKWIQEMKRIDSDFKLNADICLVLWTHWPFGHAMTCGNLLCDLQWVCHTKFHDTY